jgi:hypothetical protein
VSDFMNIVDHEGLLPESVVAYMLVECRTFATRRLAFRAPFV